MKRYFSPDVVVHTAGIMPMSNIADGNLEIFDKVIATNLRGSFIVMSQAAKHVSEGGRILAFSSSVLAKFPWRRNAAILYRPSCLKVEARCQ